MRTYYPTPHKPYNVLVGTLCEWCCNSVPDLKGNGCSWSRNLSPVPDWVATAVTRRFGKHMANTYCVHECPQFREEGPR